MIDNDEINKWENGDIVLISADTDSGKSHFIKHKLADHAKRNGKKILMLCHRKLCADQFRYEIEQQSMENIVTVMTYQKLEMNREINYLIGYDYIVCDEFHYFLDDSEFNSKTYISFEKIMDKKDAVKIFMSATGENMEKYINLVSTDTVKHKYELPHNYDKIRHVVTFISDELESFAKQIISKNKKAIFFIDNVSDAYYLYQKFSKNALFCCSQARREYKYVDKKKINKMIQEQRFDENILITTTVLDAGVNIKDKSIRNIIVSVRDPHVIKQCVGRRRIDYEDENDVINVYVKDIPGRLVKLYTTHLKNEIKPAKYMLENGPIEYVKKYFPCVETPLVYFDVANGSFVPKVNMLIYTHKKDMIKMYEDMSADSFKYGYRNAVARMLKGEDGKVDRTIYHDQSIEAVLEENIDKVFLNKSDKLEFAEKLGLKDKNGRPCNGIHSINGYLMDFFEWRYEIILIPNYYMKEENGAKRVRYQNAWKLCRHQDEDRDNYEKLYSDELF